MGGYTPTNLQQASFIPTYAGTPLEDAQKYGTDLLNTYKSNIADLTKLDIANAQRRVIEGDTAESAKYDQELKTQFETMASKGDYENMTHQVNELARRHVNNKSLKAMAETRAVVDAEDELVMKMRAAGQEPLFLQDRTKYKSVSYDEKGNPIYNVYKATAETPLDYQAKKADIWNVIKPSLAGLSEKQVNDTMRSIDNYITTGIWKGISNKTIQDKVENALTAYKGTSEYRQERKVDMLTAQEMGLEGKAADDWVESEQRRKMKAEGMLRVFSESHPDYVKDWTAAVQMSDESDTDTSSSIGLLNGIRTAGKIPAKTLVNNIFSATTGNTSPYIMPQGNVGIDFSRYSNPDGGGGTVEERKQYETLARNVVKQLFPAGTLDKFYQNADVDILGRSLPNSIASPAEAEKLEKQFLYGTEVRQKIKEVLNQAEQNMAFTRINKFDSKKINAKTSEIVSGLTNRKLLADGKVITAVDNPEFFAAVADPSNLKIYGETVGFNALGKIADNDPSFYNSYVSSYIDPKTKKASELFIAKDIGETHYVDAKAAEEWSQLVSEPFKQHKLTLSSNLNIDIENIPGVDKPYRLIAINGQELPDGGKNFSGYKGVLAYLEELNSAQ